MQGYNLNMHMHRILEEGHMSRRSKCRRVGFMPIHLSFSPQGIETSDEIVLTVDELEALRLSDYLLYDQQKAANNMEVSRGTYQRILNNARYKIAEALITGKMIQINGGNYALVEEIACCKDKQKLCQEMEYCSCNSCPKKNIIT